tara:strand:+ start:12 stop:620 length:609 start_codon:yes stop_codon:yes gene_type:complete
MLSDFWVVDKMVNLRDIYLKYKILSTIKDNIVFIRSVKNIQRCIKNKKIKEDIKEEKKKHIVKIQSGILGYDERKKINKIKSVMIIQSLWKGYKVRRNMKSLDKKINSLILTLKKRDLIENNVKRVMSENNVISVELDEKINNGLEELDDEVYYDERFNEGVDKMERGLNTNMNGCALCCCGLGNICSYLFYKLKRCINELF